MTHLLKNIAKVTEKLSDSTRFSRDIFQGITNRLKGSFINGGGERLKTGVMVGTKKLTKNCVKRL